MFRSIIGSALALSVGVSLSGCGVWMEAHRPDPVDLSQFTPGEHRIDVVKVIGAAPATVTDGPKSCDIYKLYTHGPNGGGKAIAAFGEGVTDVFTLGLAEVIWTPVEAVTENSLYTVTFCYDNEGQLLTVEEQGTAPVTVTPTTSTSASDPMPHDASPPSTTASSNVSH